MTLILFDFRAKPQDRRPWSNEMKKVYLAGPLFSEAERTFNVQLAGMLEEVVEVYLPQ